KGDRGAKPSAPLRAPKTNTPPPPRRMRTNAGLRSKHQSQFGRGRAGAWLAPALASKGCCIVSVANGRRSNRGKPLLLGPAAKRGKGGGLARRPCAMSDGKPLGTQP